MMSNPVEERWQRLLRLLAPHHDAAAATARRLCRSAADGDDLFQSAVLRAHAKLDTLRDERRFRAWFYAVLISVHRNRSRRAFWRRFLPLDRAIEQGDEPAGEDGRVWDEERRRSARVSQALSLLPAPQREAVVLFEIEGWSIEEIADMQRVSVPAVKSRLQRRAALSPATNGLDLAPAPVVGRRLRSPSGEEPGERSRSNRGHAGA